MKKIVLAVALVLLSSVAFAKSKTPPPVQNHSCILSGAVVEKTKKECIKAGGKWEKNSPATTDPAAPAAPTVDTTKPSDTPVTK
jgi:hypothetical protein